MKTIQLKKILTLICLMATVFYSCSSDDDNTDVTNTSNTFEVTVKHVSNDIASFSGGTIITVPKSSIVNYDKSQFSLVTDNDGSLMLTKSYDEIPENSSFKWSQNSTVVQVVHTVNLTNEETENLNLDIQIAISLDGKVILTKIFTYDPEKPNTFIVSFD